MKVKLVEALDSNGNELSSSQEAFFKLSKVRNSFGDLLVVYRGTVSQNERNYFSGNVKWFTSSKEYADKYVLSDKDKVYSCYLNCNNIFDCGNTDGRVFKLNPVQLSLTDDFKAILAKLNLTDQLFVTKFKHEFQDRSSYTWHIYTIVRTDKFVDLVRRSGYDCIHTIEEGNNDCYGVLYDRCIKLTSNENPTNSDKINENLKIIYTSDFADDGRVFGTYNVKDVLNFLDNYNGNDWRIVWDKSTGAFIFGSAYDFIHSDLHRKGFEKGYLKDNYYHDYLIDLSYIASPDNFDEEYDFYYPTKFGGYLAGWGEFDINDTPFKDIIDNGLTEAQSPVGYAPKKSGKAYKVFKVINGKLYPPMVSNKGGVDTPIGVWLDAEEGEFAVLSSTGRKQVKGKGGKLAYRPGWHLGDLPRASQFDTGKTWQYLDEIPEGEVLSGKTGTVATLAKKATNANNNKIFYVKELDKYARVLTNTGKKYLPFDFVWALCDYTMDIDYQPEADEQGYWRTRRKGDEVIPYRSKNYQHSYAGLQKLPSNGYYKYRTNPNPETVPWVITGQMKVDKILSDAEVNAILKDNGVAPIQRQGGDVPLSELGLNENLKEEQLDETLRRVTKDVLVTYNTKDVIDRLSENEHDWRLMYDDHEKMWLMGDANDVIHFDMLEAAWDNGYYDDQMDFITDNIGTSYENYRDCGEGGFYINEGEENEGWVDPWLYSLLYVVDNDDSFYQQDGFVYNAMTTLGGRLYARDDYALEETPLSSICI